MMFRMQLNSDLIERLKWGVPDDLTAIFLSEILIGSKSVWCGVNDFDSQVSESMNNIMTQDFSDNENRPMMYQNGFEAGGYELLTGQALVNAEVGLMMDEVSTPLIPGDRPYDPNQPDILDFFDQQNFHLDVNQRDEFLELQYSIEELYGETLAIAANDVGLNECLINFNLNGVFNFNWQINDKAGDILFFI